MGKEETRHLTKGDARPAVQKGKLRLYAMRFCPYAQRARLVLDAKNVQYDVVHINLLTKPEWFADGKVPTIEFENGDILSESIIIADFLNDSYPNPPLYPADFLAKAKDKLLIEKFSAVSGLLYKMSVLPGGLNSDNFQALVNVLDTFEAELVKRGTSFFSGDSAGMADLMMWPWLERAPALALRAGEDYKLPETRLPRLTAWRAAMLAHPTVQKTALPPEVHNLYLVNSKNGDYDFAF